MDHDFFRYLVIFIFIISALRSLFKKKPTQPEIKRPMPPVPWSVGRESGQVNTPQDETDFEGDDAAVQREIMKMFGREFPAAKPETPAPVFVPVPDTTPVPVQAAQYASADSAYAVSIPEGYQEETKKTAVSEIAQLLEKKTKVEESARRFRESIKEKLHHPESLKDYIVISEIMGKPKAFE